MVATLVWNAAAHAADGDQEVSPIDHVQSTLLRALPKDAVEDVLPLVVLMLERRQRLFAEEKRRIASVQVRDTLQGRNVNVASVSFA